MGIQTNDLEPGCLIRRSSLNPIEIHIPPHLADGISLATAFGTAGTVQASALSGVWPANSGRLPWCMQLVASTTAASNTYSYRIVGEDWFGNPVDTGFVVKAAVNLLGRTITRCFSKITSIEVNPTVFTPGDTISFGWVAGIGTDNCSFPLPFERGYVSAADVVTTVPYIHMLDHGLAVYSEYGGATTVPGPYGQAGPQSIPAGSLVSVQNGTFTTRMGAVGVYPLGQPTMPGRMALHILSQAVRERY